jgi:hypothetical protein
MSIQVTYEQILALRAEADTKIYAVDNGGNWQLDSSDAEGRLISNTLEKQVVIEGVMVTNPALEGFESTVLPNCNKPIEKVEVRFKTHDWNDMSDWDGRTHGDQVAYLAGGVMKHPVDGSWLDATGASMIAAYGGYPNSDHLGDPNYLFGAFAHRITSLYDDVNYKWTSSDGATRYAWLDTSVKPAVWRNDAGAVVVHYGVNDPRVSLPTAVKEENDVLAVIALCAHNDAVEPVAGNYTLTVDTATQSGYLWTYNGVTVDNVAWTNGGSIVIDGGIAGELTLTMGAAAPGTLPQSDTIVVQIDPNPDHMQWIRNDNSAVVTSSLWRILPYANTKLQINKVKTTIDVTATFTGSLHYQIYMDLSPGIAGPGYPGGNYKVADWGYTTLAELASGADADPYIEPLTRDGHVGPVMILSYDYQASTKTPVIDSKLNMHLDVSISDNQPVTGTLGAHATFICMKIASF